MKLIRFLAQTRLRYHYYYYKVSFTRLIKFDCFSRFTSLARSITFARFSRSNIFSSLTRLTRTQAIYAARLNILVYKDSLGTFLLSVKGFTMNTLRIWLSDFAGNSNWQFCNPDLKKIRGLRADFGEVHHLQHSTGSSSSSPDNYPTQQDQAGNVSLS